VLLLSRESLEIAIWVVVGYAGISMHWAIGREFGGLGTAAFIFAFVGPFMARQHRRQRVAVRRWKRRLRSQGRSTRAGHWWRPSPRQRLARNFSLLLVGLLSIGLSAEVALQLERGQFPPVLFLVAAASWVVLLAAAAVIERR
jgi:hypothetical protein